LGRDTINRQTRFLFACALLLLSCAAGAAKPIAHKPAVIKPPARVDARGFIDPWALRRDLLKLTAVPAGDESCSVEYDEEEVPESFASPQAEHAYWQRRDQQARRRDQAERACEKHQAVLAKAREQAIAALNRTWMPLLVGATEKQDPVAEVILRLCETAPLLDRSEVASDCSPDPAQQAIARQRLEAIGFQPALHNYIEAHGRDVLAQSDKLCRDGLNEAEAQRCVRIQLEQDVHQLTAMKAGILNGATFWNNVCPYGDKRPSVTPGLEACGRALHLNQAIAVLARRFYSGFNDDSRLSLLRDPRWSFDFPGSAWPYDELLPLRDPDNDKDSPDEYQEQFYGEVYRALREMNANIEADLRRDPRWKVFLLEPVDEQPEGPRAVTKYYGTFEGPMISQGTTSVITVLQPGGDDVIGRYLMIYGDGEKVALGALKPCMILPKNNLLCQWTDKFGHGFVNFSFDASGKAFNGVWHPDLMDRFPPMGPYKEGPTDWDGVRQ
jgi:hypothetical protein